MPEATVWRFYADTNQQHFEDALERAGLDFFSVPGATVRVAGDPPSWIVELAHELGADLLEEGP